jgi:hypothetical protein
VHVAQESAKGRGVAVDAWPIGLIDMPKKIIYDWPSERTAEATGLFARLTNAIDHGRFDEASEIRLRLAERGFILSFKPDQTRRAGGRVER